MKLKDRVWDALSNHTDKLTQAELDIVGDVGIIEDNIGDLMKVVIQDYQIIIAKQLMTNYKLGRDEVERFLVDVNKEYYNALNRQIKQ